MEWTDQAVVLAVRKHGENGAIATLLTREHGRHAGLVRGASGKRARGVLQSGNRIEATWRARLADQLGAYSCELVRTSSAGFLDDPLRLAGLSAACAMAATALPEREAHEPLYDGLVSFLETLGSEHWQSDYVRWELDMLRELGFGLDLSSCAATGRNDQLGYVSPKSGQAVSLAAGEPYRRALLPLPPFLLSGKPAENATEISDGLTLTGYFLERHVFAHERRGMPAGRQRFIDRLLR
jgi:DNA repair protein RecO (recombination protein O)